MFSSSLLAVGIAGAKQIATVLFFGFWIVLALWLIFSPSSRFQHTARLPLDEDPPALPHSQSDKS